MWRNICPLLMFNAQSLHVSVLSPTRDLPRFIELQRSGLYNANSHKTDGSKYLKYGQIIAVHDATVTEPQLSCTVIRLNLQIADTPRKTKLMRNISVAFRVASTMSGGH
jgi:hypothetical protein